MKTTKQIKGIACVFEPRREDTLARLQELNPLQAPFTAVTHAGRAVLAQCFGAGAVSVTLRKSRAADFIHFAERNGFDSCTVAEQN
jgi:hypothetical protein